MKPFTYIEQIIRMKNKSDKFDLRLRIIKAALANGIKPAARLFDTTPKTVKKWLRRYNQEKLAGINELPRIPLTCPHKTSAIMERKIVRLRKQFPFKGAKRLKREHNLPCSHSAVGRILREYNLVRKFRKKHKRKKDLAAIKAPSLAAQAAEGAFIRPNNDRYKGIEGYTALLAADENARFA